MKDYLILIFKLWKLSSKHAKKNSYKLIFFILISSFTEIISIGMIFPFLKILINPEILDENKLINGIFNYFHGNFIENKIILISIIFSIISLLSGLIRVCLLKFNTKFSFEIGSELSYEIYLKTLYRPYIEHLYKNSSEIINAVYGKSSGVIYSVIIPCINILSSIVLLVFILITFIIYVPKIIFVSFLFFALIYVSLVYLTRKKLLINGVLATDKVQKIYQALQEGLGGIREVILNGNQKYYAEIYRKIDKPLRIAQGNILYTSLFPRYGIESLSMVFIAYLAYYLSTKPGGLEAAIPILGGLAVGAQRILPIMQQIYSSVTSIVSHKKILQDVVGIMSAEIPEEYKENTKDISFETKLVLKGVGFRYIENSEYVLKNINLEIKKGDRVGIIGETGTGKSTLVDLIVGLIQPSSGSIYVDGKELDQKYSKSWQRKIAHVPQSIFLADSTIEENIALGLELAYINKSRIINSCKLAQLEETIKRLDAGLKTMVGENGVRLSGGQRQRIGIARALYKNAKIMILDEATSALDSKTELLLLNSIQKIDKEMTIIMITHRVSTLNCCNKVYKLLNGELLPVDINKS